MKYPTILVLLCLSTAIYALSDTELLQIKNDPFGSALNSLLEMHMFSEDPSGRLNLINQALDQVEELLTLQNQEAAAWVEHRRSQCANEREELEGQIAEISNSLERNKEVRQSSQEEQSTKQSALATERSNLVSEEESLRNAQQSLDDENIAYKQANDSYAEAIKACEEALGLLGTLKGSSFIQAKTQSRLIAVASLIQKNVPTKTSAFVQPIVQVLTELSTSNQINLEKLYKIINLIEQLLDELRKQQVNLENNHATTVQDLNDIIAKTTQSIENSERQIKILSDRLDELVRIIENLNGAISSSEAALDTLKDSLSRLNDSCTNDLAEQAKEQTLRDQQLDILKRLRAHFHDRVVPAVENIEHDSYYDELSS